MEVKLNQCQSKNQKGFTIVLSQGLDQASVVIAEGAIPEKHEQEWAEESEAVRSRKPKTDKEGNINSGENSAINTEECEEEEAYIQQAEAEIGDDTKEESQSRKSTMDPSTTKTDAKKASDKRSADPPRSTTMPKSYGRSSKKDIAEKFGGVATSGIKVKRSTSCGAGAVKNMLLEWCRAKTRGREGVDIQNFSSSWSNGLAFCALIVAFFPDAFDYDSLDPKNRRHNFQLAFTTAEERADCPPLLDIEDMVRMKVPDSKCVYTYVQELYRSLVAKGLVKTKKA